AIADVADPGPFGSQKQSSAGGAHPLELRVLLATAMDAQIGFDKGFAQGRSGPFVSVLGIGMRDDIDRQLAGQLADGVGAHAVRAEEEMASSLPLRRVVRGQDYMGILVVAAPPPHVRPAGSLYVIEAGHQYFPRSPCFPRLPVCYPAAGALHSGPAA